LFNVRAILFLVKIKGTDANGVRKILKLRGFMLRNPFPEDQYLASNEGTEREFIAQVG